MRFPDFIKRMLGLEEKLSAHLANDQKLAEATKRIAELEALQPADDSESAAELLRLTAERDQAITDRDKLKAALDAAETKAAADLTAERSRTANTLAGLGVAPETLPAPAAGAGGAPASDPVAKLRDQLTVERDPKRKFQISQQIQEAIAKSK